MFEIEYEVCREDINSGKPYIETVCAENDGALETELANIERAGYNVIEVWRV